MYDSLGEGQHIGELLEIGLIDVETGELHDDLLAYLAPVANRAYQLMLDRGSTGCPVLRLLGPDKHWLQACQLLGSAEARITALLTLRAPHLKTPNLLTWISLRATPLRGLNQPRLGPALGRLRGVNRKLG
jgi:hypothetical protein